MSGILKFKHVQKSPPSSSPILSKYDSYIMSCVVTDSEPTDANVHNTEDVKTGIKEEGRDNEQKSIIPVAHLYTLTKIGPALNR